LSRNDRIRVQTLREIGWTYGQIVEEISFIYRQVQFAAGAFGFITRTIAVTAIDLI